MIGVTETAITLAGKHRDHRGHRPGPYGPYAPLCPGLCRLRRAAQGVGRFSPFSGRLLTRQDKATGLRAPDRAAVRK
jgi:hypothetical protein